MRITTDITVINNFTAVCTLLCDNSKGDWQSLAQCDTDGFCIDLTQDQVVHIIIFYIKLSANSWRINIHFNKWLSVINKWSDNWYTNLSKWAAHATRCTHHNEPPKLGRFALGVAACGIMYLVHFLRFCYYILIIW